MQSETIGKNQAGQRLDRFLHKYLPNAGSGFLYKMLRRKNITLNGRKAEGAEILKEGDFVCCYFSPETFEKLSGRTVMPEKPADALGSAPKLSGAETAKRSWNPAVKIAEYESAYRRLKGIQVIYEDGHFLVLNKPAGILSQKANPGDSSVNEWMIGYLLRKNPSLERELATFRPSVCNRLDRNTSGIVLCGKTITGLQFLNRYIQERRIQKFYHTICVGELKEAAQIQGYLLKDEKTNKVQICLEQNRNQLPTAASEPAYPGQKLPEGQKQDVRKKHSGQKLFPEQNYIRTGYTPLSICNGYTYLEVELITGKPHQIRAHLAGTGHPLIGDFKYGNDRVNRSMRREFDLHHQLLHAYRIAFPEITSGAGAALSRREFIAPEPELFKTIRTALKL